MFLPNIVSGELFNTKIHKTKASVCVEQIGANFDVITIKNKEHENVWLVGMNCLRKNIGLA